MTNPCMVVPFNDLGRSFPAQEEVLRVISEVIKSGWWINGRHVEKFCDDFCNLLGVPHCIPVANGTDAIEIAVRAIISARKMSGNEIVTVANAGGYTTTACYQLGLVPVYADIEVASQLISLPSALSCLTQQTALVVVTHLYGGVVDVSGLRQKMSAAGYGHVPIMEDCAQAHGAALTDRPVGSLSDIAAFSFYPTKNLGAMGDAGAIVTSDDAAASLCRMLHQYGWSSKYRADVSGGRNSRMDEIQAAILHLLLPHLKDFNRRRQDILRRYENASNGNITIIKSENGTVAHLAVVLSENREDLRQHLNSRGISCDVHYPILDCDQLAWREKPHRICPQDITTSRWSVHRILSIPCFPTMTEEEISRVCDALARWSA